MNEEMKRLLDSIKDKKQEVRDFCKAGRIEDATKAKEELKNLQAQFDLLIWSKKSWIKCSSRQQPELQKG